MKIVFGLLFFILLQERSIAQVLHAVVACDVKAETIGPSVKIDKKLISKCLENGLKAKNLNLIVLENLSRQSVLEALESLQYNKGDSVLFYFSGHGSLNKKTQSHQLKIGRESLMREHVWNAILENRPFPPHMVAVITDCCYSPEKTSGFAGAGETSTALFESLFFGCVEGTRVDINACIPNQFSFADNEQGSVFTRAFCFVSSVSAGPQTWSEFLRNLRDDTSQIAGTTNQPKAGAQVGEVRYAQRTQRVYLFEQNSRHVAEDPSWRLGVEFNDDRRVLEILDGSPATGRLKRNDLITHVNGQEVSSSTALEIAISNSSNPISLTVKDTGKIEIEMPF